jgi:hypothetical protein
MLHTALKVTSRAPLVSSISRCSHPVAVRPARVAALSNRAFHVRHPTSKASGLVLLQVDVCKRRQIWHVRTGIAPFHSSRPTQALPVIPMLLGALKASSPE